MPLVLRIYASRRRGGRHRLRQLSSKCTLVRRARFAARNIRGEVREFVQQARHAQSQQHRHHDEITRTEFAVEPVGIAEASGKLVQPIADATFDQRQALLAPGLIALQKLGGYEFKDRRFDGVGARRTSK